MVTQSEANAVKEYLKAGILKDMTISGIASTLIPNDPSNYGVIILLRSPLPNDIFPKEVDGVRVWTKVVGEIEAHEE